jgi:hypothetical protein
MPVSKTRKKTVCKVVDPLDKPLTAIEKAKISDPPWRSLKQCMLARGNATDWYNLMFRIGMAHEITLVYYSEETINEVYAVLLCLLRVKNHRKNINEWTYSEEDIQLIDAGLIVADQLGNDTPRRSQHAAMVRTKAYLKQFL